MTFAEIERVLGKDRVKSLQALIQVVCSDAAANYEKADVLEAMGELLIANLAALLVIPKTGGQQRATGCGKRLVVVVDAALKEMNRSKLS